MKVSASNLMPNQAIEEIEEAMDEESVASAFSWPQNLAEFVDVWLPAVGNLGPLFIFLSALVALWGIWKNSDTAKKRATLDLIEKSESTTYYRDIGAKFRDTFSDPLSKERMDELVSASRDSDKKLLRAILDFINHYELMSIGIRKGALHKETYKLWMMTTVIRDWNHAAPLIQQMRWRHDATSGKWSYNDKLFSNFQHVSKKWAKGAKLKHEHISKDTGGKPKEPRGAADEAVPRVNGED